MWITVLTRTYSSTWMCSHTMHRVQGYAYYELVASSIAISQPFFLHECALPHCSPPHIKRYPFEHSRSLELNTMRQTIFASALLVAVLSVSVGAFAPAAPSVRQVSSQQRSSTRINGFLGGDDEPQGLTRDNEPEDFFQTNTDKMTDAEKLPIALAGLAFVSLPFLAGMIALYASK